MQMNPHRGLDTNVYCVKIEGAAILRDEVQRSPKYWLVGTWDKGGMTQTRANLRNRRSYRPDAKGERQQAYFGKPESTDAVCP